MQQQNPHDCITLKFDRFKLSNIDSCNPECSLNGYVLLFDINKVNYQ